MSIWVISKHNMKLDKIHPRKEEGMQNTASRPRLSLQWLDSIQIECNGFDGCDCSTTALTFWIKALQVSSGCRATAAAVRIWKCHLGGREDQGDIHLLNLLVWFWCFVFWRWVYSITSKVSKIFRGKDVRTQEQNQFSSACEVPKPLFSDSHKISLYQLFQKASHSLGPKPWLPT